MAHPRSRKRPASEPDVSQELPFEAAFAQMQQVIEQLERGDLPLDGAIAAFERGMALAQRCNILLDNAQLRVQALEADDTGAFTLLDIEVDA